MEIDRIGTFGVAGTPGALGADSTAVTQTSGNGGDGTDGTDGTSASYSRTNAWVAAHGLTIGIQGGYGGAGGSGGSAGKTFVVEDHTTTGTVATWHDTWSNAGNGGSGGNGGDGADGTLTIANLTAGGGVNLYVHGGWGGAGGDGASGGEGANSYVEHLDNWQVVDGVAVSRDWTIDSSAGGSSGRGGDSGNGGDAVLTLRDSTIHGSVYFFVEGGLSQNVGDGGVGTGGTTPNPGADGGNGGNGGSATILVDHTAFDFNATVTMWTHSLFGGTGGFGGYGGDSHASTRNNDVVTNNYSFAEGGNGGDGGNGGNSSLTVTHSTFMGTTGKDTLNLQLTVGAGSAGGGGGARVNSLDTASTYKGQDGQPGHSGELHFDFDGNDIDGGAGNDTLMLFLTNFVPENLNSSTGIPGLGTVTIDLEHGTMSSGDGANTIENVENIDVFYAIEYGHSVGSFGSHAVITGNDADNTLRSAYGNNSLSGGGGDDVLVTGSGVDALSGGAGNDKLDGGKGNDIMKGGDGNDFYNVDGRDVIVEYSGQGIDTVSTAGSYTLGANFENLVLTKSADRTGSGNSLDNHLTGNIGNNVLRGFDGNDVLDGGKGADTMYGGKGDDTFYVDNVGDVVIDYTGQGSDSVISSVTFTLGGAIENLTLTGSAALTGTGNALDNILVGNTGNNVLDGGKGHDLLTGGLGADTFVFGLASSADTIRDFSAGQNDMIDVHAYHAQSTAVILQAGADTTIDLGGGNIITVTNSLVADVNAHIVW